MADSAIESVRKAQVAAVRQVEDFWRQLMRNYAAAVPGGPEVQSQLESLGSGILEYMETLNAPLREMMAGHREFADQMARWAEMQGELAAQMGAWARKQQGLAGNMQSLLSPATSFREQFEAHAEEDS
jgi:hypothetical protein